MEDNRIIELYWERNEKAIKETDKKYGKYCNSIAYNILQNDEDSKECINDTYLNTWNAIPPHRPAILKLFLGKITRNLALNRHEKKMKKQKTETTIEMVLHELEDCIVNEGVEQELQYNELVNNINNFLKELSEDKRKLFLERYWYVSSIKEISKNNNLSESNTKLILYRIRIKLKKYLEEEKLYE